MGLLRRTIAWSLAILCFSLSVAGAQENLPRLGYAFPAGGRQGTTFQVTVGGQFLTEISRIRFSGSGVEAKVLDHVKPLTEDQFRQLRQQVTDLGKGKRDPATVRRIAEIQRKLSHHLAAQMRRQTHPAIGETVALEVSIRADAEPGDREMRIDAGRGISNPLRFSVGLLPEFREGEPDLVPEPPEWNMPLRYPATVTTDIPLPAVANGQIIPREPDALRWGADRYSPGDSDRYRFHAKKGQEVVAAVAARQLVPYLADAVPGWFQATLSLYDAQGRELAFADDFRFHPDPVLFFKVPEDGAYTIEIKDAICRGRPDFVYRVTVGELPYITGMFPRGGRAGEETAVALTGSNLPSQKRSFDARGKAPGIYPMSVRKGDMTSNAVPFAVDTLPESLEREPNDTIQSAQPVALPTIVNGRVDRSGDWDVFRIEGLAGQRIVAEVLARRLDSPLDSVLELTDAAGKRLAFNDDHEDKADALHTHHADSLLSCTLPSDGAFFLRVGDAQRHGGPEHAYRLRVSPPRPDFDLRVAPSCIHAVSWRFTPVTIFALRKDGFSGDIALRFKDGPEGLFLGGGVIPAGQDRIRVTLAVAPWAPIGPTRLCLEGRAEIDGREIVREAVPADDMMQAFAYKHLVPARELTLLRTDQQRNRPGGGQAGLPRVPPVGQRAFQGSMSVLSDLPLRFPAGGKIEVRLRMPGLADQGEVQINLSDAPEGITIDKMSRIDRGMAIEIRSDAAKAKPGLRGNLIANVFQNRTLTTKEGKTQEYRSFMGPLPAMPFEVVAP